MPYAFTEQGVATLSGVINYNKQFKDVYDAINYST